MLTASAFLATFFLACLLALVRHPVFGLVAYLSAFYVHPPSRWWVYALPDLRWSLVAAGFTFAGLLIHRHRMQTRPIFQNGIMIGIAFFVIWIAIQSIWALDQPMHIELLDHYVKFTIAAVLIYKCIDSERHLKFFLWAHVIGCFAFGLSAFLGYTGGRFEGYGGPGFSDANYAGIQAVTGIFAASILMLSGNSRERLAVAIVTPFIMNGLVTTVSRSSFLALVCGGVAFIWLCPARFRISVSVLGVAALAGFLLLSHEQFWERMETITFAGEEVTGVDTGAGRRVQWEAQGEMFAEHPFGCGHRCTATLSPQYLDDRHLTGPEGNRARSSHNTFLTMLVEQGFVGGILYALYLFWLRRSATNLRVRLRDSTDLLACALPGVAAILLSITVADIFVDYLKLEVRIWYIAIVLVIYKLSAQLENSATVSPRSHKSINKGVVEP